MPTKKIASALSALSQLGWGNGVLYLIGRTLQAVSGNRMKLIRYYLVAQPVPASPTAQCRPSAKNPVRIVGSTDPIAAQFPRPKKVIEHRFESGASCFVAESGERFAGFLWLAHGAYEEDEVRCRYELAQPQHSVWDYDVHVEPEFRIGRTFVRLWDAANVHLAQQGIRWSISRISAFNPTSLAAHSRLGIRPLHSATFLCIGSIQIAILGLAPFLHFSFSKQTRPIVRLTPPDSSPPTTVSN